MNLKQKATYQEFVTFRDKFEKGEFPDQSFGQAFFDNCLPDVQDTYILHMPDDRLAECLILANHIVL